MRSFLTLVKKGLEDLKPTLGMHCLKKNNTAGTHVSSSSIPALTIHIRSIIIYLYEISKKNK
jgi:hypothetical protein